MSNQWVEQVLEAAILAYGPISKAKLVDLFEQDNIERALINEALAALQAREHEVYELLEVASGYRFQIKSFLSKKIQSITEVKPSKYSRAFLETLVLIAYRQPVTRSEIEDVRGVAVSSYIMKGLIEREWVKIVGHKDVPGRPALFATTKTFLDYFNLKTLNELPTLAEVRSLEQINIELDLQAVDKEVEQTPRAVPKVLDVEAVNSEDFISKDYKEVDEILKQFNAAKEEHINEKK